MAVVGNAKESGITESVTGASGGGGYEPNPAKVFNNQDVVIAPSTGITVLTAAMSTTVGLYAGATRTAFEAKVSWLNNGASGTAKLYGAINCNNPVEGLVASQSAKQRDFTLTMGESVVISSPVPISGIHFSSDTSILANTHNLSVIFGL